MAPVTHEKFHAILNDYYATGEPIKDIVERHGVSWSSFWRYINIKFPELRRELDMAKQARAHAQYDRMPHIAETEENPHRARVMLEAIDKQAKAYDRQVFGDKVDMTIGHLALDLAEATQRAVTYRPLRDLGPAPAKQVIDVQSTPVLNAPDLKSEADIDPFS